MPDTRLKMFLIGNRSQVDHFLSDPRIRILSASVVGELDSSKDFELSLMFQFAEEKTTLNKLRVVTLVPLHVLEPQVNALLTRKEVTNLTLLPFTTKAGRSHVVLWEEDPHEATGNDA